MSTKEQLNTPLSLNLQVPFKILIYLFNNQNDFMTNYGRAISKKINVTNNVTFLSCHQLERMGLIRTEKFKRQKEIYLTPKGLDFAMKLNEVDKFMKQLKEEKKQNDSDRNKRINIKKE